MEQGGGHWVGGRQRQARLQVLRTPSGNCDHTWCGLHYPRVNYTFARDHVADVAGAAPVVQPQNMLPPPPLRRNNSRRTLVVSEGVGRCIRQG